jgi:hypothetical protein
LESDFNYDGLQLRRLLFQNTSNGQVSIREMNGNNVDRRRGRNQGNHNFPAGVNNQFDSSFAGGAVQTRPLFVHSGRGRVVFGQSTAQSRDRVLLEHLAKTLQVAFV